VKEVVEAEFAAEGYVVEDDKLPRAAGRDGAARLAVYPDRERQSFRDANVLDIAVVLQVYLPYTAEPDETIAYDPGLIEAVADRLRRAFQTESDGATEDFWFLHLTDIEYPDDPTGNRSRLEATFSACATNHAALG
jgi:hypothetical protein